jgi:hypothetical protein
VESFVVIKKGNWISDPPPPTTDPELILLDVSVSGGAPDPKLVEVLETIVCCIGARSFSLILW